MELKSNQIVKTRRGDIGVVMNFHNVPSLLVFQGFVSQLSRYNENLKCKNANYDIVEVYNSKKNISFKDVYKKSFDLSKLELVYKEGQ